LSVLWRRVLLKEFLIHRPSCLTRRL
jgi:hypothetical protein